MTDIDKESLPEGVQLQKISYQGSGIQPPVFLAGSFSSTPWEPKEMEYTKSDAETDYLFSTEVSVSEGEYQYKFRVGHGDWWVLDESMPTSESGFQQVKS
jgi:hypothetical protein